MIIDKYTRESGVRSLDKIIAKIMRQIARKVAMNKKFHIVLDADKLKEYLGSPIFPEKNTRAMTFRELSQVWHGQP